MNVGVGMGMGMGMDILFKEDLKGFKKYSKVPKANAINE